METREIAELAANVLYLEDPDSVDSRKSLFLEYRMSSIDFIDFAFELKSRCGRSFSPDDLWPVNSMMTDPEFYAEGRWTERGTARLRQIFRSTDMPESPEIRYLYSLFSVEYIARRIVEL